MSIYMFPNVRAIENKEGTCNIVNKYIIIIITIVHD